MSDIYKLQYNSMTLAYPGWNGAVSYENAPAFKTLTLCATEGGTLTAETITGLPGDTITLSPIYNTYWRFSGYDVYGDGTLSNNTYTFGEDDEQIVSAYFKKNAFTATGGWEKGSNIAAQANAGTPGDKTVTKYAIHGSHTGDIPSTWYATSNRWNVNTTPSAYKISLVPKMYFNCTGNLYGNKYYLTACTKVGTSTQQNYTVTATNNTSFNYSKSFTSDSTGVNYSITAHMYAVNGAASTARKATMTYIATATTGTWSATGYAP